MTEKIPNRYETDRVRLALALDEAEAAVMEMCAAAIVQVEEADHFENHIDFELAGLIDDLAEKYRIEEGSWRWNLVEETKDMVKCQVGYSLQGKCDVQYIRQIPREDMTLRLKFFKR